MPEAAGGASSRAGGVAFVLSGKRNAGFDLGGRRRQRGQPGVKGFLQAMRRLARGRGQGQFAGGHAQAYEPAGKRERDGGLARARTAAKTARPRPRAAITAACCSSLNGGWLPAATSATAALTARGSAPGWAARALMAAASRVSQTRIRW